MQEVNMPVVERVRAFISESPRYKLIDYVRAHITTEIDESRIDPKIKCPFHGGDNTPSFVLRAFINRYHCFGCDTSGDYVNLVSEFSRISENLNIGYYRTMENILRGDPEMVVSVGANTIFKSRELSMEEISNMKPRFFKPSGEKTLSSLIQLSDWMGVNNKSDFNDIKTAIISAQRDIEPEDIKSILLGQLRSDIIIPDMSDVNFDDLLRDFEVTMDDS